MMQSVISSETSTAALNDTPSDPAADSVFETPLDIPAGPDSFTNLIRSKLAEVELASGSASSPANHSDVLRGSHAELQLGVGARNPLRSLFLRVVTDGSRRLPPTGLTLKRVLSPALLALPSPPAVGDEDRSWGPKLIPGIGSLSVFSAIGGRKSQEDRYFVEERVNDDVTMFGIFDGTVGCFASHTAQTLAVPVLRNLAAFRELSAAAALLVGSPKAADAASPAATPSPTGAVSPAPSTATDTTCADSLSAPAIRDSMLFMSQLCDLVDVWFAVLDSHLLELCRRSNQHYASTTGVVTLIVKRQYCVIAHVGDSRAVLGMNSLAGGSTASSEGESDDAMAYFVTDDHKPNQGCERNRIRACGGSVEYLHNHNNKPFIRGGDFAVRKARGEQPMQLQYSRAFGGKDLKPFGLSNEPDIVCFKLDVPKVHRSLVLGSDGVWDVIGATAAAKVVEDVRGDMANPAAKLVRCVLQHQASTTQQPSDNVTAAVLIFDCPPS